MNTENAQPYYELFILFTSLESLQATVRKEINF